MPCRAVSSACRQAAQCPPSCLWITDDILADAWSRFAHVSNANHQRRSDGRRFGSNVPGPLEARRRLAKRRMGLAAAAANGSAPGSDFGALFGLSAFEGERKVGEFTYKPPGREPLAVGKRSGGWIFGVTQRQNADVWDKFLQEPEALEETLDPVRESQSAFEKLLDLRNTTGLVRNDDMADLLAFLQSAENESGALNTLRLVEWLSSREIEDTTFTSVITLVLDKVRLETLHHDETSKVLALLLRHAPAHESVGSFTAILDAFNSEAALQRICTSVTQNLLNSDAVDKAGKETISPAVRLWLRSLRSCRSLQGTQHHNATWRVIYDLLSSRLSRPSTLLEHMSTLATDDLAQILLRHWIPRTAAIAHSADAVAVVDANAILRLSWMPSQAARPGDLSSKFHELRRRSCERENVSAREYSPLVDLLDAMQRSGISPIQLSHDIFDILTHSRPASTIYRQFCHVQKRTFVGVDTELAMRLIQHFRQVGEDGYALGVFRSVPTVPLSRNFDFVLKLAQDGSGPAWIWSLLQRQTPCDLVSTPLRNPNIPEMTLIREHVDLVHLVAFTWAKAPSLSSRQAFRYARQCYLFLRDRRAPVSSLMTRALVTAGIIRPLQELRRVSTVKFRWIISIVSRVEGPEVVEALDQLVYRQWRGKVLPTLMAREARETMQRIYGDEEEDHQQPVRQMNYPLHRFIVTKNRSWLFDTPRSKEQKEWNKRNAGNVLFPKQRVGAKKQGSSQNVKSPKFDATMSPTHASASASEIGSYRPFPGDADAVAMPSDFDETNSELALGPEEGVDHVDASPVRGGAPSFRFRHQATRRPKKGSYASQRAKGIESRQLSERSELACSGKIPSKN